MKNKLGMLFGLIGIVYFTGVLLLYLGQRDLLYFPTPETQISGYDRIEIDNRGNTVEVWAARGGSSGEAIVYFGGNAENLVYSATLLKNLFPEKSLYLPNYRGYGGSAGEPSEAALYEDALATYDWLEERHSKVAVIGRSLGSGVATYVAANREINRLVLVTPFDSLESIASEVFYVFPVNLILKDKYDSVSRASAIHAPTLMITAQNDEFVSRPHSDRLLQALKPVEAEEVVVDGSNHNDIATKREYAMALLIFLESSHVPEQVY